MHLCSPDAKWDSERGNDDENAKYRCLDSGQGCGSGTSEKSWMEIGKKAQREVSDITLKNTIAIQTIY